MYISSYWPPNSISTIQSEEPHVMDHLSKFHLNRTVNEPGNAVLWKLRKLEKWWRHGLEVRRWRLARLNYRPTVPVARKVQKTVFFVNRTPHTSLVWRLAANWVPPGGSCFSRNPEILPLHLRSPNTPWSSSIANFTKSSLEFIYSYKDSHPKPIHSLFPVQLNHQFA